MKKHLLAIFLLSFALLSSPVSMVANSSIEIVEQQFNEITITISESVLHVTGANGQMLYIYNVAGVRVMSVRVEGADKHYELNLSRGCYIVKVGNVVRKISIK